MSTPAPTAAPTMGPCSACKFFDGPNGNLCRVNPPQISPGYPSTTSYLPGFAIPPWPAYIATWPTISQPDIDWCGVFVKTTSTATTSTSSSTSTP